MLNDTLLFDSDDEYRFTGTETRPNEIVAVAMERGGMIVLPGLGARMRRAAPGTGNSRQLRVWNQEVTNY
jgi:hypothetical protein